MARIIKTAERRQDAVSTFEHSTLEEILMQVAQGHNGLSPSEILADARADAEQKVEEAYAEGLRRGQEAGEEQFRASVGEAAEALAAMSETLKQSRDEYIESLEPQLIKLAGAMAAQILRRECSVDPELITRTARSVLDHVMDQERVTLRVHPKDMATLKERRVALLEDFDGIAHIEILSDESIGRGGCVAVTPALHVDGRLESQLEILLSRLAD